MKSDDTGEDGDNGESFLFKFYFNRVDKLRYNDKLQKTAANNYEIEWDKDALMVFGMKDLYIANNCTVKGHDSSSNLGMNYDLPKNLTLNTTATPVNENPRFWYLSGNTNKSTFMVHALEVYTINGIVAEKAECSTNCS